MREPPTDNFRGLDLDLARHIDADSINLLRSDDTEAV